MSVHWSRVLAVCTAVVCLFLAARGAARAADARIVGASSSRNGHVLAVSFSVADAFTPKMEEAILSGIPQAFTYLFEVYRVIPAWPNMRIYNWQVKRTIRYDTLKKTFTVEFGEDARPKQTQDFAQAKRWMTEFNDFPVAVAPALESGSQHYVRVKAQLDPVEWPLYLNRLLFFANLWSFETAWQRIDLPAKAPANEATPAP
jgi:hypothetical protein